MKIINPHTEILTPLDGQAILQHIELCGRVCQSEDKSPTPAPPSLWRASSSVAMRRPGAL
ncbi:MAG: hypothetical protein ACLSF6_03375 [Evtepia gabavorous]